MERADQMLIVKKKMQNTIVWMTVLGVILLVGIGMIYALRVPQATPKTYPADKGPQLY